MDANTSSSTKVDVYSIVTNRIIQLLEKGTIPWRQPWTEAGIPMNLISKRPYRGINLWLLLSLNYQRNLFLTWDQLKKIGGSVKQGEHGHVVVFWRTIQKPNEVEQGEKKKQAPLLRYYKVFNIEQCRDLPEDIILPLPEGNFDPIAACETVLRNIPGGMVIKHKEPKAFYDPRLDYINMPKKSGFKKPEGYYGTLFHEVIHWSGSEKRLKRKSIVDMAEFGSELYSMEELIAELGASYLASHTGILLPLIENSAAYISNWLGKFKNDKRFVIQASSFAQRAVDYLLNHKMTEENAKEETEQPELLEEQ